MTDNAPDPKPDCARRRFLLGLAAMGGLAVAPGVTLITTGQARAPEEPASAAKRWGLLVDVNKCATDCTACISACTREIGLKDNGRPATDPQWIRKVEVTDKATGKSRSLPVMCQHCDEPACVDVCPTGASFKRADGIVLVDRHVCIGCRYCMMACPYKARSFVHEQVRGQRPWAPRGKGTVEGCTLCVHRIDAGGQPACVEACAEAGNGALTFGDLNDPNSAISQALLKHGPARIRPDLGMEPKVFYQGL